MKSHPVVLFCLVLSLVVLQGCAQGGTWFPKASRLVRSKTYWDTVNGNQPLPKEPEHKMSFEEQFTDPERFLDNQSVRESKR